MVIYGTEAGEILDDEFLFTSLFDSLLNIGGPRSRVRTEPINSTLLAHDNCAEIKGTFSLHIPDDVYDIEAWVLKLASEEGLNGWNDINDLIFLPKNKLIITHQPVDSTPGSLSNYEKITAALILSKCNKFIYLPSGPRIFTRERLNRNIKLVKLNINQFYEME
ncbi:MAG: hypothetical protein M3Q56_08470 [Bacteroidota bacterium]|nr:hypothetical protein [Bacteroidota bacterium]